MVANEIKGSERQLISVEILRAIAALSVFAYHQHLGNVLVKLSGFSWFRAIDIFGAIYAVPLFFLISGYCIHLSSLKYIKQGKKLPLLNYFKCRFLRIYPAYCLALVFSWCTGVIVQSVHYESADVILHLLLLQAFSVQFFNSIGVVLWTVSIEIALYLLYPIFYEIRMRYSLSQALMFVAVISAMSITYNATNQPLTLSSYYFVLNIWFTWCIGASLTELSFETAQLDRRYLIMAYLIIIALFVLVHLFDNKYLSILAYQFKILIWSGPFLWFISFENSLRVSRSIILKLFSTVGISSYSLYLLHDPLITLKNFLVHKYLPVSLQLSGVICGMLVIPVISWLCFKYIEKPMIKIGKIKVAESNEQ